MHTHTFCNRAFLEVTDKLATGCTTGCTTRMRMRSEQLGCREWALHIPPVLASTPGVGATSRHPTTHPLPLLGRWESDRAPAGRGGKAVSAISSRQWEGLETPLQLPWGPSLPGSPDACQQGGPGGVTGKAPPPLAATQTHRVKSPSSLFFALGQLSLKAAGPS